jgi:hypothetical protein
MRDKYDQRAEELLPELPYDSWYAELRRIADATPNAWLVSLDPEDHRVGYEDGFTPMEEYLYQFECAI